MTQDSVFSTSNSQGPVSFHRTDSLLRADEAARDHTAHPGLPHEPKPSLATESLHGAGAGIGLGSGAGGYAYTDAHITAELSSIYSNIQKVLDLRHKYIRLSLQGPGDNPKDDPSWDIYPPHPEPVWEEGRTRTGTLTNGSNTANDSMVSSTVVPSETAYAQPSDQNRPLSSAGISPQTPRTPKTSRPKRKPGQDIGTDFEFSDLLPLPGPDEMRFRLDENSIYQIYES